MEHLYSLRPPYCSSRRVWQPVVLGFGVGDGRLVLFQSLLKALAIPSNSVLAVTLSTLTWYHAMGHWCSGKAPFASYQASPKTFLPPQGLLQGGG